MMAARVVVDRSVSEYVFVILFHVLQKDLTLDDGSESCCRSVHVLHGAHSPLHVKMDVDVLDWSQ